MAGAAFNWEDAAIALSVMPPSDRGDVQLMVANTGFGPRAGRFLTARTRTWVDAWQTMIPYLTARRADLRAARMLFTDQLRRIRDEAHHAAARLRATRHDDLAAALATETGIIAAACKTVLAAYMTAATGRELDARAAIDVFLGRGYMPGAAVELGTSSSSSTPSAASAASSTPSAGTPGVVLGSPSQPTPRAPSPDPSSDDDAPTSAVEPVAIQTGDARKALDAQVTAAIQRDPMQFTDADLARGHETAAYLWPFIQARWEAEMASWLTATRYLGVELLRRDTAADLDAFVRSRNAVVEATVRSVTDGYRALDLAATYSPDRRTFTARVSVDRSPSAQEAGIALSAAQDVARPHDRAAGPTRMAWMQQLLARWRVAHEREDDATAGSALAEVQSMLTFVNVIVWAPIPGAARQPEPRTAIEAYNYAIAAALDLERHPVDHPIGAALLDARIQFGSADDMAMAELLAAADIERTFPDAPIRTYAAGDELTEEGLPYPPLEGNRARTRVGQAMSPLPLQFDTPGPTGAVVVYEDDGVAPSQAVPGQGRVDQLPGAADVYVDSPAAAAPDAAPAPTSPGELEAVYAEERALLVHALDATPTHIARAVGYGAVTPMTAAYIRRLRGRIALEARRIAESAAGRAVKIDNYRAARRELEAGYRALDDLSAGVRWHRRAHNTTVKPVSTQEQQLFGRRHDVWNPSFHAARVLAEWLRDDGADHARALAMREEVRALYTPADMRVLLTDEQIDGVERVTTGLWGSVILYTTTIMVALSHQAADILSTNSGASTAVSLACMLANVRHLGDQRTGASTSDWLTEREIEVRVFGDDPRELVGRAGWLEQVPAGTRFLIDFLSRALMVPRAPYRLVRFEPMVVDNGKLILRALRTFA